MSKNISGHQLSRESAHNKFFSMNLISYTIKYLRHKMYKAFLDEINCLFIQDTQQTSLQFKQ
jgi:hypothetical protein